MLAHARGDAVVVLSSAYERAASMSASVAVAAAASAVSVDADVTTATEMLFAMLGYDALEIIFTCLDPTAILAASLACRQFNALRVAGRFQTDVMAMNSTPTMFAWATRLGCPSLRCVRDLNDSSAYVRLNAMQALGRLDPVTIMNNVGEIVLKLDDPYVCVRYMAVKAMCRLEGMAIDDFVLTQHVDAIAKMMDHADAGVRATAMYLLGKLDPVAIAYPAVSVALRLDDPCVDVRYTSAETLRRLLGSENAIARLCEHTCPEMRRLVMCILDRLERVDETRDAVFTGPFSESNEDGVGVFVYLLEDILDGNHPMDVSYVERIERIEFHSPPASDKACGCSLTERLRTIDRWLF